MHYAASTHVHLFCIPTYVSWCELNAHPTWLMPSHVFPSLLFSGSFVQCAQLFLQFLTFPIPGRSIIIALNDQHMRLIERLPYALCRFHTRSFILHSDVRFMMRVECASNMVNAFTGTSKRLRFPLFTWKYLHFLYMQKIVLLQS
jgi:hypothetical protein